MNTLTPSPTIVHRIAAPIARTWQGVQNKVANILGSKDAGVLSKKVTALGISVLAAATVIFPPLVTAGAWLTTLGVGGMVENDITNRIARSDGK